MVYMVAVNTITFCCLTFISSSVVASSSILNVTSKANSSSSIVSSSSTIKSQHFFKESSKTTTGILHKDDSSRELDDEDDIKHDIISTSTSTNLYNKIQNTITRSKDAVWATIALTFLCVVLFLAVAISGMWKDYHVPELQGVPLPKFNERVPFQDVMRHKIEILRELVSKGKKKKKKEDQTELESLLTGCDVDVI